MKLSLAVVPGVITGLIKLCQGAKKPSVLYPLKALKLLALIIDRQVISGLLLATAIQYQYCKWIFSLGMWS